MPQVRLPLEAETAYRIGHTVVLDVHAEQDIFDCLCYVIDLPPERARILLARMDRIVEWKKQDDALGSANFYEITGNWANVDFDAEEDLTPKNLDNPESLASVDGEHIKVYDDVLYFVAYYGDITIESDPLYRKDLEGLL